jgi:hypothetical protein
MSAPVWKALRKMVARRDGYRCRYCGVPTAATIEHIIPRAGNGGSRGENLCLACPWCNTYKNDRPLDEFLASGDWQLPKKALPNNINQLLEENYNCLTQQGVIKSGSTNARLLLIDDDIYLEVRAGKGDDWQRLRLGQKDNARVVSAADDFLRRHFTKPNKD